ncbi:MAG TPA: Ig-like domain-containing protein, partial [Verrucomicrobiae bacterium]|nr:Ig-like domain-containing protein [Verrucomicrobiae bacterium]
MSSTGIVRRISRILKSLVHSRDYPVRRCSLQRHGAIGTFAVVAAFSLVVLNAFSQPTNLAVVVRHAPNFNGSGLVEGSVQQLLAENVTFSGGFTITGDLLVPGNPALKLNGKPNFAGTLSGSSGTGPTNYQVTLNGSCSLRHVWIFAPLVSLPTVSAPPPPTGTRRVEINSAGESIGDPATLRDLALKGGVGQYAIPPGTYGDFIAQGGSGFTLGVEGSPGPAIYNLQNLVLNGQSRLEVVGPVILTVANGFAANGVLGNTNSPSHLQLQIASGGLTLHGGCSVYANVTTPAGTIVVNGNSLLMGLAYCDRLTVNSGGIVRATATANQPPTANSQSLSVPEDGSLNITLTGNDAEGAALTYLILNEPGHGIITGDAPNLVYTPTANFDGTDSFTFKVNDGQSDSATATISITVTPVNDAPVAQAQTAGTPEDTPLNLVLRGSDVEGSPLTFAVVTSPEHGDLSGVAPHLTYTPSLNYSGPDSFTYLAIDDGATSAVATVSITVHPVGDAPVAADQTITTDEDLPVSVTLTAVDAEGDPLQFTLLTQPAHGTLTGTPPDLNYSPHTNYHGEDAFTFKASDADSDSLPASVTLTVRPLNDPPEALVTVVATYEDMATNVVLVATDADGDALSYRVVEGPADGTLIGIAPELVFSPAADFHGTNTFTFVAADQFSTSAPVAITVIVMPQNDVPVAEAKVAAVDEDVAIPITLTGTDADDDVLTFTVTVPPTNGTLSGSLPDLVYTPATNFSGADAFAYEASDGQTNSLPALVMLSVVPVNDAPVAENQSPATDEDTPVAIEFTGNDVEGDPLTFRIVSGPAHGSVSGDAPNLVYTPALDYFGEDQITFVANDGVIDSEIGVVSITIGAVSDAPVASPGFVSTAEDTPAAIVLVGTDAEGEGLSFQISDAPQHGTLIGTAPDLIYVPAADFVGIDSFTFVANDGHEDSSPGVFLINVSPVNDAPQLSVPPAQTMEENTELLFSPDRVISVFDVDSDSEPLELSLSVSNGVLKFNSVAGLDWIQGDNGTTAFVVRGLLSELNSALGSLSYLAATNYSGEDTLVVIVNDLGNTGEGGPLGRTNSVSLTVSAVNDAPVFVSTPVTSATPVPLLSTVGEFDFSAWTPVQYEILAQPDAVWVATQSNQVVLQNINSDPAIFVSDVDLSNERVHGTWTVQTAADDDFVGFVFGYQDPQHFYLFDWKQASQTSFGFAEVGMSVKVMNASTSLGADDLWPTFPSDTNRVRTIYHNTVPWQDFASYQFTLDFRPGHFTILIYQGDTLLANITLDDSTYTSGRFGFYNHSQEAVRYTGFTHSRLFTHAYAYDVDALDPEGGDVWYSLVQAPPHMSINPTNGVIQWHPNTNDVGSVTVIVRATDAEGVGRNQTFVITVPPIVVNQPPFVSAGPDRTVGEIAQSIMLDGVVLDDSVPTNQPVVSWSALGAVGNVTFGSSTSAVTTASFDAPGLYVLQLKADDTMESASDLMEARVGVLCSIEATPDLVAWWPGNWTATERIGKRDVILSETTGYSSGKVGPAFQFNAATDFARAAAHTNLNLGQSAAGFTIEFWAKPETLSNGGILGWAAGVRVERVSLATSGDALRFHLAASGIPFVTTSSIWPNTNALVWTHIALTYDRPLSQARIYANGVLMASGTVSTNFLSTATDFYLGQAPGSPGVFVGELDEISLYRRPLGAQEVYEIFAAGNAGKCPNDSNAAPLVHAGPDLFVTGLPGMAMLYGQAEDDGLPAGSTLQALWTKFEGPGAVDFGSATSLVTSA